jgi:hypothetical protein
VADIDGLVLEIEPAPSDGDHHRWAPSQVEPQLVKVPEAIRNLCENQTHLILFQRNDLLPQLARPLHGAVRNADHRIAGEQFLLDRPIERAVQVAHHVAYRLAAQTFVEQPLFEIIAPPDRQLIHAGPLECTNQSLDRALVMHPRRRVDREIFLDRTVGQEWRAAIMKAPDKILEQFVRALNMLFGIEKADFGSRWKVLSIIECAIPELALDHPHLRFAEFHLSSVLSRK